MNLTNLPPAWQIVPLGKICAFQYGSSLPARDRKPGSVPVFGSNGIVGYHDAALTNGTTIVIGRKGSIGEIHFCQEPCWAIDTTYFIDETSTGQNLHWLSYLLQSLGLNRMNKAAAVPGLNRNDAYQIAIALPPLDEQRRIAAVIDAHMQEVERARTAAQEQLQLIDQLPTTILRQAIAGEL